MFVILVMDVWMGVTKDAWNWELIFVMKATKVVNVLRNKTHWKIFTKDASLMSIQNNQRYYVQYWFGFGKNWVSQLSSIKKSILQKELCNQNEIKIT